jgi:hypothetical protein
MMDFDDTNIAIPAWDGIAQHVLELWRLQRGTKIAVRSLGTDRDRAELRLMIDGKLRAADASHYTWALSTVALGWKERLLWLQGWR